MKDNISITVPIEYEALIQAAKMFNAMAGELQIEYLKHPLPDKICTVKIEGDNFSSDNIENMIDNVNKEDDAATVFSKNVVPLHSNDMPPPHPIPANPSLEGDVPPPAPIGVELDSDGLPWDARIHGKNKLKLAKTQQWKKRRGVDPVLVETVEAELHAAMSAAPINAPIKVIPPAPPAPVPTTETPESVPVSGRHPNEPIKNTPVPPAPPTGITFPELMAKITTAMGAGTMTEAQVIAACNNKGMASLALVAVRPDVIPEIVAELFPS